ncbi:MAG: PRTRC system protein E [Peptostreptococcaceae bacterium]|nr:PRTRC system protein E [Peptostreptococcaceae bacterium]
MNEKLEKAVAIYRKLGYEETDFEKIVALGTGSAEDQKIAREGLKSGEWWEFQKIGENSYGSVNIVGVDLDKLAIFAIKVGVDPKRAANVLGKNREVALAVISERGEKYAADFIAAACTSSRRPFEHDPTVFGALCVHLTHRLNLQIPENVEYIKDWAAHAARAFGIIEPGRFERDKDFIPPSEMIKSRFKGHIEVGIAVNAPATGPFSKVFVRGVQEGLLTKEEAISLAFLALDKAVRPGDRKEWMLVLDELEVSEAQIVQRAESLIPLLAFGETPISEKFAPILISQARDDNLPEVLINAFAAKSKKIRQMILKTALNRKVPKEKQELGEWIMLIRNTEDKTISKLAEQLMSKWDIAIIESEEEEDIALRGLWQKTPRLWQVPKFELGEISAEHLTELVAEISNRKADIQDMVLERFLGVAHALAHKDLKEAKLCLVGVNDRDPYILKNLKNWAKNQQSNFENMKWAFAHLLPGRNILISCAIEKLPAILSMPSYEDLSIDLSDLSDRLMKYKQEQFTHVLEPDLHLALTRLDIQSATKESLDKIKKAKLFIVLQDGEKLTDEGKKPLLVSDVILAYLKDPYIEPPSNFDKEPFWNTKIETPSSLRHFPNRFGYNLGDYFSIFPLWGDFALTAVRRDTEVYHGQGLVLRQVARRRKAFEKGTAINFLAVQSYLSDANAEDVFLATTEAWERGLLVPGVADVAYLDWRGGQISNLASLAKALDQVAEDGILSVVWSVLDDLIDASLKAPRMIAGTADLAKVMQKHLDEVFLAIQNKIADKQVLELKGIRMLAKKTGSSVAIIAAKEIVKSVEEFTRIHFGEEPTVIFEPLKKENKNRSAKAKTSDALSDKTENLDIPIPQISFDEVWQPPAEPKPLIDDGATMTVEIFDNKMSAKPFLFCLRFPEDDGHEYKTAMNWVYSLDTEGQIDVMEVATNTPNTADYLNKHGKKVWLRWDEKQKKIVKSPCRNWVANTEGPLEKNSATPLSLSLLTIAIGLLAQDGDMIYTAPRLVRRFIQSGELSQEVVRHGMETLLQNEAVSPAKLVRVLEKETDLLSVLWVMLSECIQAGGTRTKKDGKPPIWINRVLDICIYHGYYLKEAMNRGLIPKNAWEGLEEMASCKAKSAAKQKAERFMKFILG